MLSEGAKPGTPQIKPSRIFGDSMELRIVVRIRRVIQQDLPQFVHIDRRPEGLSINQIASANSSFLNERYPDKRPEVQ